MQKHQLKLRQRVFLALKFILLFGVSGASMAGTMTVTLSLPAGAYTLPSDMNVWVRAVAIDGGPGDFTQSFQTFSETTDGPGSEIQTVLALDDALTYVLQYDCHNSTTPLACREFVPRLFANSSATNGTVLRESEAQTFNGNQNHADVDLPIQIGIALTGTLQTTNATNATEDIDLTILARNSSTPTTDLISLGYTIESGSSSVDFEIHVPDDDMESWYIGYSCVSVLSPPCDQFLQNGYRKSGAPNNTVEDYDDADPLVGDVDQSGINFRLLGGYSISGTLTAPMAVADAAGLRVMVTAQDQTNPTNSFSDTVLIPQSGTSENYFMTVSTDPLAEWIVRYTCDTSASPIECGEYLTQGYYNNGTMVETSQQVDPPLDGGESHANIDLTMMTGPTLSGTIELSDAEAPAGGLSFSVRAAETANNGGSFSTTVLIAEGATEADFSINVGADVGNEYRISYECNEGLTVACEDVVDQGYYDADTQTTVYVLEDATSLANEGLDVSSILLTVDSAGLLPDDMCVAAKTVAGGTAVFCL